MPKRRDWAKTLRPASFRGVPFECDEESVKNVVRQAVHEIPNGTWTVERLGRGATEFNIRGYVISDQADERAFAIGRAFQDDKRGTLVLPMYGPIQASPIELSRDRSANKHGYVALNLRFVYNPLPGPAVSTNLLANAVFVATGGLIGAIVGQVAAIVQTVRQVAYVVDAAIGTFSTIVGVIERIRTSSRSDASAATAVAMTTLGFRIPEVARDATRSRVFSDWADAAVALGFGIAPAAAIADFRQLRQVVAPALTSGTDSAVTATVNAEAIASLARVTALAVEAEALARMDFVDRDAADAARIAFAGRIDAEINALATTAQRSGTRRSAAAPAIAALSETRRAVIDYLTAIALDLAPRVTVESNESQPAIVWAWQLYADPSRSRELARSNRVRRPAMMPTRFRAQAPAAVVTSGP